MWELWQFCVLLLCRFLSQSVGESVGRSFLRSVDASVGGLDDLDDGLADKRVRERASERFEWFFVCGAVFVVVVGIVVVVVVVFFLVPEPNCDFGPIPNSQIIASAKPICRRSRRSWKERDADDLLLSGEESGGKNLFLQKLTSFFVCRCL